MAFTQILLVTGLLAVQLLEVYGHGMMMDPVSRSSAWRKGFPVEPNYNDNSLFCGGYDVMWNQNGGRCGLCGDNYDIHQPRPNENRGVYGTGVIVERYNHGETINVNVKLTANHMGKFTFHMCRLPSPEHLESEDCFNEHPLQLADGTYEQEVSQGQYEFNVPVRLPEDVTCEQCVIRWTYTAGNNWGECSDGTSKVGCGPQETFKNCADVSIS
ncbi:uncharacterized protein LOC117219248 [Megalopta genalis]|uniref:uncharacterized protein LOC117219248 n=1 Tax=Megalopta genalis TaxID=115081 RepID=UPI003FD4E491